MDKVIFLDIDGVLNSLDYMNANYSARMLEAKSKGVSFKDDLNHKTRDKYGQLFDPRCVCWLTYIIKSTDAKIVISSSWRLNGLSSMIDMWSFRGLEGDIIGVTECLNEGIRGDEIQRYIDDNGIKNYCIIDDDNDMLDSQLDNYVQTDGTYGLSLKTANKVIDILNK